MTSATNGVDQKASNDSDDDDEGGELDLTDIDDAEIGTVRQSLPKTVYKNTKGNEELVQ
jgi:hypothetical protein